MDISLEEKKKKKKKGKKEKKEKKMEGEGMSGIEIRLTKGLLKKDINMGT